MARPVQLPPEEAYSLWAATYDGSPNALLALEERCLHPLLANLDGQMVLDVACGTGRQLQTLVAAGAHAVGVDLTRTMLTRATAKLHVAGRCAQADALHLPFRNRAADLVLGSFLVGYVNDLGPLLTEIAQAIRPGGRVILTELHPDAVRAGWRRTFRAADRLYEPKHVPHSIEAVQAAADSTGLLEPLAMTEHTFGEPEHEVFERAGKTNFDELKGQAALWIGVWRRCANP